MVQVPKDGRHFAESVAPTIVDLGDVRRRTVEDHQIGSGTFFFFFLTGAHKLLSFGLAGTATKRAKGGYTATTASSWVKVKPLRAKSAAQIKTRRAPNADSNGR
ncbi:BQ5605_C001g00469 [Microbotryum silenes-dioicae]|uniref:BQ5605_C001g00469 protein n=1 Tax=Microbotryum silenes-dioicae TaxID=796604 RepID=A0A2X0M6U6_9BASI|nr:BQ5605_C001g00469 [Microbotryum silenes-dioicae]